MSCPRCRAGLLLGYINGQNRSRSSVAMTAPVVESAAAAEKVAI